MLTAFVFVALVGASVCATASAALSPAATDVSVPGAAHRLAAPLGPNQAYIVPYLAWNGKERHVVVLLPADYVPGSDEVLPCIVNPHARNSTPYQSAKLWHDLPTTRRFMVICANSSGRRDPYQSWSAPGQIRDLGSLPDLVTGAMPWLRIDRERLYVLGGSMGGQETLSLLARYPDRFAAALSIDGLGNLTQRYYELAKVHALDLQADMRREVGGTPRQVPFRYRQRSPITFARTLATCRVPLSIWWSEDDVWVINQATTQTGWLCKAIRRIDPAAALTERMTSVDHGMAMLRDLPLAIDFFQPGGVWRTRPQAPARWEYRGWASTSVWHHRFTVVPAPVTFWRVEVTPGSVTAHSSRGMTVRMPYADDRPSPATVVVDGVARSVTPSGGTLEFTLHGGASTALINPGT